MSPLCPPAADPPPFIDGIRINSPHYLTKIKLTSAGTHTFTLVVSQYEKQNTINYTLRVRGVFAAMRSFMFIDLLYHSNRMFPFLIHSSMHI